MDYFFINFKGVNINKYIYTVDSRVDNLPLLLIISSIIKLSS